MSGFVRYCEIVANMEVTELDDRQFAQAWTIRTIIPNTHLAILSQTQVQDVMWLDIAMAAQLYDLGFPTRPVCMRRSFKAIRMMLLVRGLSYNTTCARHFV